MVKIKNVLNVRSLLNLMTKVFVKINANKIPVFNALIITLNVKYVSRDTIVKMEFV